ncbi:hypothetical protein [Merismopedia glauca]|uniref:Uncharacterized protein n=1 Tax=Merismopedia glauca CCAP 1448/3 TaxID=1296344 RepID=A0A2T1C1U9_9CYAN|nr:hypothetical protein [Merismopedia glauca]PSB02148.1 hypothetical protein C7B64_14560 [Merismopedia glauca CCAP 1448/3]
MKVWIATFILLFAIAELFEWLQKFSLPLPIYILGGALLAIASNYQYRGSFPFSISSYKQQLPGSQSPEDT